MQKVEWVTENLFIFFQKNFPLLFKGKIRGSEPKIFCYAIKVAWKWLEIRIKFLQDITFYRIAPKVMPLFKSPNGTAGRRLMRMSISLWHNSFNLHFFRPWFCYLIYGKSVMPCAEHYAPSAVAIATNCILHECASLRSIFLNIFIQKNITMRVVIFQTDKLLCINLNNLV